MKTTTETQSSVGHEQIAQLARQIWEREGRRGGQDLEYWLRAERELLSHSNRPSGSGGNRETETTGRSTRTNKTAREHTPPSKLVHI